MRIKKPGPKGKVQLEMLSKMPLSHGGELFKTRKGRAKHRPLDTKSSMHLVLRSTSAVGDWSFTHGSNRKKITELLGHFAHLNGIKLHSFAIVGNHIHVHFKLFNRYRYEPFIKSLTSAIVMAVTRVSRFNERAKARLKEKKFWDYRPFTRVVRSLRAFLNMKDYINLNQLEGFGLPREQARFLLKFSLSGPGARGRPPDMHEGREDYITEKEKRPKRQLLFSSS